MQRHLLACALFAALCGSASASDRATYLVRFAEAPLASFRGGADADPPLAALKATSPGVTGQDHLDVDAPAARAYRRVLRDRRDQRLRAAGQRFGRSIEPVHVYDVVLNGVALSLSADEAAALAAMPDVVDVRREGSKRPLTDGSPQWIGAADVWTGADGVATRGEGVVVGIIDTGINRGHPSFAARGPVDGFQHANPRGRYYGLCATDPALCNDKVIGQYDFTVCTGLHASAGCDDREINNAVEVYQHGSHVASIAAGNLVDGPLTLGAVTMNRRISGVAPHANLIAYKACESEEVCRDNWLLAALEQAAIDRVDVVNYSIGDGPAHPWTEFDALAILALREAGTVVAVAAGNEGPVAGTVGSPGDAPWGLSVGSSTHDRMVVNRLVDLVGGITAPPADGAVVGFGYTGGYGPADLVKPADHPGCARDVADPRANGASNPWSRNHFRGQIVVCETGLNTLDAIVANVRLAGGGGVVLVNGADDGDVVYGEAFDFPTTRIGHRAGQALIQWLAGSGTRRGRIEGAQARNEPAFGDLLSEFSARGPVAHGNYLQPALTAPGDEVIGAARNGNAVTLLGGTSMASPHVAGAAALVRARHPQWSVTDVESALQTTARAQVRLHDGRAANTAEQGSGRLDVAAAVRAGLAFDVTPAEFRAADPAAGGRTETLNLPVLVDRRCKERCTFTRRVKDLAGGGRWRVEVAPSAGMAITATPAEFELAAGASQAVRFDVDVSDRSVLATTREGSVTLRRTDAAGTAPARLPVSVFADPGLPAAIAITAAAERGYVDIAVPDPIALGDLQFTGTPLAEALEWRQRLQPDPNGGLPYGESIGVMQRDVVLPATTGGARVFRLHVVADSPTSADIDLYVGIDRDGDRGAEANELVCESRTLIADEACDIVVDGTASEQRVWMLIQNYTPGADDEDDVILAATVYDPDAPAARPLVATGPSGTERGRASVLRVQYDDPTLTPGARRIGSIGVRAAGVDRGIATIPVTIVRSADAPTSAKVLAAGDREHIRLGAGTARDRLVIDVPPNAGELVLRTQGSGEVDLYAAYAADPAGPAIAAAPPREQADASAHVAGANEEIRLSGAALRTGRWYVTPVNAGTTTAEFDLTVSLAYAGNRVAPHYGAYYNPARSGAGAFLFPAGDLWGFAWYTYLQDGTPTWYLGVGPRPGAQEGAWKVDLLRYRWNGTAAIGTVVGRAVLSLDDPASVRFSWNLDGQSGSERYQWVDGGACPQRNGAAFDASGLWFSPDRPGFGYSINAYATVETNGAYFYDAQGIARWAFASTPPLAASDLSLELRRGFCPLCDYAAPTASPVGTLRRTYDSAGAGRISADITLPAPLSGRWQVDLAASKLSEPLGCD